MSSYKDMNLKQLIEMGIRSEMDAQEAYGMVAEQDIASPLERRLRNLKKDEKNHEKKLRDLFREKFPDEDPQIPESTKLPDDIKSEGDFIKEGVEPEADSLAKIIERAMEAEKDAQNYHETLKDKLEDEEMKKVVESMSHMEEGHYNTLKHELEGMRKYGSSYGAAFKGPGF